jgi:hypothetical protein
MTKRSVNKKCQRGSPCKVCAASAPTVTWPNLMNRQEAQESYLIP